MCAAFTFTLRCLQLKDNPQDLMAMQVCLLPMGQAKLLAAVVSCLAQQACTGLTHVDSYYYKRNTHAYSCLDSGLLELSRWVQTAVPAGAAAADQIAPPGS